MPFLKKRTGVLAFLLILTAYVSFIGTRLCRAQQDYQAGQTSLQRVGYALGAVQKYYYKPFHSEKEVQTLVEQSIQGMLSTLDPHTNYIDPDSFRYMTEEQAGKFYGIGIQFNIRDGYITVISAIDDTPASRLGIRPGDRIMKINGEDAHNIDTADVIRKLRGEKGTTVHIHIQRPGETEVMEFDIERAEIPLKTVQYRFMATKNTGYIYVSSFAQRTRDEIVEAIDELKRQGMKQLILDLRDNPGGLLDAAKKVGELFLAQDQRIVYTRGRQADARMDLYAEDPDSELKLPLVVLVNQGSASASEIVAGAIQDHDRGVIVGMDTFGKGLVQRLFPLPQNQSALQVTTAKYYTPSGRCIQKPFTNTDYQLVIDDDRESAKDSGEVADVNTTGPMHMHVFRTDQGRKVQGGGGIKPDYVVDASYGTFLIGRIRAKGLFFNYAIDYTKEHPQLQKGFHVPPEAIESFRKFITEEGIQFEESEWKENHDMIKLWLKREIAALAFDENEGRKVFIQGDEQVKAALKHFDEAMKLLATYRQHEGEKKSRAAR